MANAETHTSEPVIEVEGLTKAFGSKVVVRNLTMRVNRGQIYGFPVPTVREKQQRSACCAAC